jgi:glycerol-3-phosphate acyltransferase PlsY
MDLLTNLGILLLIYVLGSIPFGFIWVKLLTGKDVRSVQSGRTGGTNAMRAGGYTVGVLTVVFDILKGASGVWLASWLSDGNIWMMVLGPVFIILGHNYSIFLPEKNEKGHWRLRGGAGGAPCVGGSIGLWWPSIFIIMPLGAMMFFFVGYASLATMSVALFSSMLFAFLALSQVTPWEFVIYGVLAEILLVISLIPNIKRLMQGTERRVGIPAKRMKTNENSTS